MDKIDRRIEIQIDGQINRQMDKRIDKKTDGQINRQMDKRIDKKTERTKQTGKWTNK